MKDRQDILMNIIYFAYNSFNINISFGVANNGLLFTTTSRIKPFNNPAVREVPLFLSLQHGIQQKCDGADSCTHSYLGQSD